MRPHIDADVGRIDGVDRVGAQRKVRGLVGPRRIDDRLAPERRGAGRLNPDPRRKDRIRPVFPGDGPRNLAQFRPGTNEKKLAAAVGHVDFLRPGPPGEPRERAVLVLIGDRDIEPDHPVVDKLGAEVDPPLINDIGLGPLDGHFRRPVGGTRWSDHLALVPVSGILDDRRSAAGMGRVHEDLAAILRIPPGDARPVEHDRIIAHFDGDIKRVLGHAIRHPKSCVEVVLAGELVAVFDAGDGIGRRILRPVAQVAVNFDARRRIGDADRAVLAVDRARPEEHHCGEDGDKSPIDRQRARTGVHECGFLIGRRSMETETVGAAGSPANVNGGVRRLIRESYTSYTSVWRDFERKNRRIADDASADIALTNARKPESLGRGLSVCLGRDLDRLGAGRAMAGTGRNWQVFAGSPSPRSPIPARPGRQTLFRGEEIGLIVSSFIPKRTVRKAKRCHRPEG